jgi:hypothetical protein
VRAYRDTLAFALTDPRQYGAASVESSRYDAWLFGTLTFAVSSTIAFAFMGLVVGWFANTAAAAKGTSLPGWLMGAVGAFYWVGAHFGFWLGTLLGAFVLRVSCRAFSVPLRTGALWRMIMFSFGPCLFSWVPVFGIGTWVFALLLLVFGVSERGRVSGGRASAAVLLPVGLSLGALTALWIAITIWALLHGKPAGA